MVVDIMGTRSQKSSVTVKVLSIQGMNMAIWTMSIVSEALYATVFLDKLKAYRFSGQTISAANSIPFLTNF